MKFFFLKDPAAAGEAIRRVTGVPQLKAIAFQLAQRIPPQTNNNLQATFQDQYHKIEVIPQAEKEWQSKGFEVAREQLAHLVASSSQRVWDQMRQRVGNSKPISIKKEWPPNVTIEGDPKLVKRIQMFIPKVIENILVMSTVRYSLTFKGASACDDYGLLEAGQLCLQVSTSPSTSYNEFEVVWKDKGLSGNKPVVQIQGLTQYLLKTLSETELTHAILSSYFKKFYQMPLLSKMKWKDDSYGYDNLIVQRSNNISYFKTFLDTLSSRSSAPYNSLVVEFQKKLLAGQGMQELTIALQSTQPNIKLRNQVKAIFEATRLRLRIKSTESTSEIETYLGPEENPSILFLDLFLPESFLKGMTDEHLWNLIVKGLAFVATEGIDALPERQILTLTEEDLSLKHVSAVAAEETFEGRLEEESTEQPGGDSHKIVLSEFLENQVASQTNSRPSEPKKVVQAVSSENTATLCRKKTPVGPHRWIRPFTVEGKDPALVAQFQQRISKMLPQLINLSVLDLDNEGYSWARKLEKSGLLEASQLHFRITTPLTSHRRLLVAWNDNNEGRIPTMKIQIPKNYPIDEYVLICSILTACGRERGMGSEFSEEDIINKGHVLSKYLKYAEELKRRSNLDPMYPYLPAVIAIQKIFFEKETKEILEMMKRFGLSEEVAGYLETRQMSFRLHLRPLSGENKEKLPYIEMVRRLGDTSLPVDDLRKIDGIFFNMRLSDEILEKLTEDQLWQFMSRSLVDWFKRNKCESQTHKLLLTEAKGDAKPQEEGKVKKEKPKPERVSQELDIDEIRIPWDDVKDPKVAEQYAREFSQIPAWIDALNGITPSHSFSGLKELNELLPTELSHLWQVSTPIDHLAFKSVDRIKEIKKIAFQRKGLEGKWKAEVQDELLHIFTYNAIEWLQIVTWTLRNANRDAIDDKIKKLANPRVQELIGNDEFVTSILKPSFESTDHWSFLRLFWDYERLLSQPQETDTAPLMIGPLGEGVKKPLLEALVYFLPVDRERVEDSLSERPYWIFNRTNTHTWASRIFIITTSIAQLIHFNGKPEYSKENWKTIMKLILRSPQGLTWLDLSQNVTMRTNRPELLIEEGEESWYDLNPKYKKASAASKTAYRDALKLFMRYAEKTGRPVPSPTTSLEDLERLYLALLHVYHPDKNQGKPEFQKITRELMEAFKILGNLQ